MATPTLQRTSTTKRRGGGLGLAAVTAVISGFAIYVNRFGVAEWKEFGSLPYTTVKNLVAGALLVGLFFLGRSRLDRDALGRHWRGLLAVAVFGGAIPFALFFEGLSQATSTQAALLHKSLVLWVAALAIPFLGEKVKAIHFVAIGLLIAGQIVLAGGVTDLAFGTGEIMILGATLLWSVEVVVAKRLLSDLAPLDLGIARLVGGSLVLAGFGIVAMPDAFAALGSVTPVQAGWVIVTGAFLAGYVFTWLHALSRAPAVDVTAVLVGSVVITALLDTGPAALASPGLVVVACGVAVLVAGRRLVRA